MAGAFNQAWSLLKEDSLKTRSDQLGNELFEFNELYQALTAAREARKPQPLDFSQPEASNYPRVGDLMERIQRGQDRQDTRDARRQSLVDGTYQRKNYTINPDTYLRQTKFNPDLNTYSPEAVRAFDEKQNGGDEQ